MAFQHLYPKLQCTICRSWNPGHPCPPSLCHPHSFSSSQLRNHSHHPRLPWLDPPAKVASRSSCAWLYRSTYNPARWLSIELCLLRCLWALRSGTEAINWQYATTQQQCQGYRGYSINARGRPCASTFPCPGRLPWPAPPPSRSTRLTHVNTVYQFALQKLFRNIKCALLGLSEFCKTI